MRLRSWLAVALGPLLAASRAGAQSPSELARLVFEAEASFANSMAVRDFDAFAEHVAEEAIFFGNTGAQRGKRAVLEGWRPFFEGPDAPFAWRPETVEVLDSGTLALSSGPVLDRSGQRIGTFNSIWRRDPDGRWRVVFDKGCP
jgi:ketosteroid isomerase-like protein